MSRLVDKAEDAMTCGRTTATNCNTPDTEPHPLGSQNKLELRDQSDKGISDHCTPSVPISSDFLAPDYQRQDKLTTIVPKDDKTACNTKQPNCQGVVMDGSVDAHCNEVANKVDQHAATEDEPHTHTIPRFHEQDTLFGQ